MEHEVFPGKYHQTCCFSIMLVYWSVNPLQNPTGTQRKPSMDSHSGNSHYKYKWHYKLISLLFLENPYKWSYLNFKPVLLWANLVLNWICQGLGKVFLTKTSQEQVGPMPSPPTNKAFVTRWWFQPIWKILVKIGSFPQGSGWKLKNIWVATNQVRVVQNPLGQKNLGWAGWGVPKMEDSPPWLAAWWHGLLSRSPVLGQRPPNHRDGHEKNVTFLLWYRGEGKCMEK